MAFTNFKLGAVGELLVAVDLLARGWEVYRNLAVEGPDLVIHKAGVLLRVEVTTVRDQRKFKLSKYPGTIVATLQGQGDIEYWTSEEGQPSRIEP